MKMSCAFAVNATIGYINGIIIILPYDVKPNITEWLNKFKKRMTRGTVRLEYDSNKDMYESYYVSLYL